MKRIYVKLLIIFLSLIVFGNLLFFLLRSIKLDTAAYPYHIAINIIALYISVIGLFLIYGLILFQVWRIFKAYSKNDFISNKEQRRFKIISFSAILVIPLNGLFETFKNLAEGKTYTNTRIVIEVFLNSFFTSPMALFFVILSFIVLGFLPKAEKQREELGRII